MKMRHQIGLMVIPLLAITFLAPSKSKQDVFCENDFYRLTINGATGSIMSLEKNGRNLIHAEGCSEPLFTIRFRDASREGEIHEFDAGQSGNVEIKPEKNSITMTYGHFPGADLEVRISVSFNEDSPLMRWNLVIDNNTPYTVDHIDFPDVVVPNDLVATGGSGRIFWPAQEGCLIEDIRIREESPWLKYTPIEYPKRGWGGTYPSSAQMQYMAYYNEAGGLYLAAHDAACHPKGIEFHRVNQDGIKLDFRLFPGAPGKGLYRMPYDMVLGVFEGDWYDASDIYRNWRESSDMIMPPRILENVLLPEWYVASPVIITYPVRGHRDLGDMTPNELFPYARALQYINHYQQAFDSKILALLMHWEGTAPWAPPYVWPPYGGEGIYLEFVRGLHENGNLAGLYASGTGYTLRSNTDTTYNMYREYEEKGLEKVMKVAPDGSLATNGVCAGPNAQRIGYDMCPANGFVKEVVLDQISKIVQSGTDYIQYFDQNLGGSCYPCYGTVHGHAYGPGLWQVRAMQDIFRSFLPILREAGHRPLIGCEAAAAEGYMPYLLFNDARATINLFAGTPVPAYAFVYHEYVNNFMGNQNGVSKAIDIEQSPLNFLQRLAYAFCAGDMLTVILRGDGQMIWDWGTAWEDATPDQEQITELIKHLNGWRKGAGKDFLVTGRMLKPLPFEGAVNIPMISRTGGRKINFPSVLTSNWQSGDGRKAQFFVNYLPEPQKITVRADGLRNVRVISSPAGKQEGITWDRELVLEINPLHAVMVVYSD